MFQRNLLSLLTVSAVDLVDKSSVFISRQNATLMCYVK